MYMKLEHRSKTKEVVQEQQVEERQKHMEINNKIKTVNIV